VDAQIGGATQVSDASGWLSVGDAAMTLDPLSSRGISSALASSLHAAHALTAWWQGDTAALTRYGAQLRAVYAAHLEQRLLHYQSERRFPKSGFWQRQAKLALLEQGFVNPPG
jgi:flavin-dependent dehydrogenase